MDELEKEIEMMEAEVDKLSLEAACKAVVEAISLCAKKIAAGLDEMAGIFLEILAPQIADLIDAVAPIVTGLIRAAERDASRSWLDCPRKIFPGGLRTVDKRQDIRQRLRCAQISRR